MEFVTKEIGTILKTMYPAPAPTALFSFRIPSLAFKNWRILVLPPFEFHAELNKERWKQDRFTRMEAKNLMKLKKKKRIRLPYNEAKEVANRIWPTAQTSRDYFRCYRQSRGDMTPLLPLRPDKAYITKGWTTWSDFLA